MPDVAKILGRIRSHGANVLLDGRKLQIVNRAKLPAGALDYIKAHGREIADFLDREAEVEERAAVIEFDGGVPRKWAEQFADLLINQKPAGVDELDWSWFITRCGQILDEAPPVRRAA